MNNKLTQMNFICYALGFVSGVIVISLFIGGKE